MRRRRAVPLAKPTPPPPLPGWPSPRAAALPRCALPPPSCACVQVCTSGKCAAAPSPTPTKSPKTSGAAVTRSASMSRPAASCTDKVKNGLETDVDCGGGKCPVCAANLA
jgi:hypothetical protein